MFKVTTMSIALAALATPLATPALAGPSTTQSTDVAFADLDLSTAEGQAKLESRIDAAARAICQVNRQQTGSRVRSAERKCYRKARASVRTQVAQLIEDQQRGG